MKAWLARSAVVALLALAPAPAIAAACALTTLASGPTTVVACTDTTATTITLPADWNPSNNKVEVIGGGQDGSLNGAGSGANQSGAGGSYAKKLNFSGSAGSSVPIQVGTHNPEGNSPIGTAGDTWFSSTATLLAHGGNSTTTNVGDVVHVGGASAANASLCGSGGGGAAGPSADGVTATACTGSGGSNGGAGDGGSGGGGGAGGVSGTSSGQPGATGNEFATGYGSGGGGGGGAASVTNSSNVAGPGANFGAGGGGAKTSGTAGVGKQGIIVLTYSPFNSSFVIMPPVIP